MTEHQTVHAVPLADRVVIRIAGPEAAGFLQGLVTVEIEARAVGEAGHGALLTPQGKVQFDFLLLRTANDTFLLDVARDAAADFLKRLMFYRLRAAVEIRHLPDYGIVFLDADSDTVGTLTLPEDSHVFADPRSASIGHRGFVQTGDIDQTLADAGCQLAPPDHYHQHRIAAGIPEAPFDFDYGAVFAHDIGLDQTGGVDFDKGCFVGQEVVSRMKHRGTARRRIVQVAIEGTAPERGTPLTLDGARVGEMGSHAEGQGLAVVRIDNISAGDVLQAGDATLTIRAPEWAGYGLGSAGAKDESAA